MFQLTDEKRAKFDAFIASLSQEEKDQLNQEFADILAMEIDREHCRADWKKSPEDDITDDNVRRWRKERDEYIVAQLKAFVKENSK